MTAVANMSKQQVRATLADLLRTDLYGREYLLHLRHECEVRGDQPVASGLKRGATRRSVVHDDPGGAEQMEFCADVIRAFGSKGLVF